jgi:hypothetical protein
MIAEPTLLAMKTPVPRLRKILLLLMLSWLLAPVGAHAQSLYAGIYEGSFSGPEGDGVFMVMSRASGTSTMLLFVYGGTHERKLSFPVNAKTGAFSFKTDEFGTLVTGTIDPAQGTYTNEFGTGEGSGSRLPFSGALASAAGYYKGTYKGVPGSGAIWAILAADGTILTAFDDPDSGGGASGQVNSDGSISWENTSSGNLQINATMDLSTNTFKGTADQGFGPVSFSIKRTEAASAEPIVIDTQPQHSIVPTGDGTRLEIVTTSGEGASIQWQKNGKNIPGANRTTLNLPRLTLSDAGAYRVILSNSWGTVTSSVAELTVVDSTVRNVDVFSESPQTSKIVLSARTAGKVTGFSWARMNGSGLARTGFKVAGATTATLTITPNAPLQTEDEDSYICTITGPGGSLQGGIQNLRIMGVMQPMFAMNPLPEARQNFFYETQLFPTFDYSSRAKTWKLKTGSTLPSGLKITADGKLSGIPKIISTGETGFTFTIQATNRAGTSEQTFNLVVKPQGASVAGVHIGLAPRSMHFNNELGGRLDLTVSATGGISGKVTLGASAYPVAGAFNARMGGLSASLVLKTSGAVRHPTILLNLLRDPIVDTISAEVRENNGDATAMAESIWLVAQRCPYSKSNRVLGLAGRYHLELGVPGIENAPEGPGYAILTLTDAGAITWGGKLADGTAITGTSLLSSMGGIPWAPLHLQLYGNTGSVQGQVALDTISQSANGNITWLKQAQAAATTSYAAGFPELDLPAIGSIYNKTSPLLPQLGLTTGTANAQVTFLLGGLESDITQSFTLAANGTATFGSLNPYKVSLKIDPSTGLVTGGMIVPGATTAEARKATLSGILVPFVPGESKVTAHFLLPQPAVPGAGKPSILSGTVELTPAEQ